MILQLCFLVLTQGSWKLISTPGATHGCLNSLIIIAWTWEKPRCPSADEWVNKLWYVHKMAYCSMPKGNSYKALKRQEGDLNAYY